jgi:pimeloyl-ACP methyl ester carboxylesterase
VFLLSRCLLLLPLFLAFPLQGRTSLETSVKPQDGEKYRAADFRLWLPEKAKHIRAVIIRQHGCRRKGLDYADDVQWQALARKWDCALMGTHFEQNEDCTEWWDPARGSERALLTALKTFAESSKHSEIAAAPWLLWGQDGGASWARLLTLRHPERVIGVFARSMAASSLEPKALDVPMILCYGGREKTGRFKMVHDHVSKTFAALRPKGALWSVAIDPLTEHNCGKSRALAIPFFDTLLAQRLPPPEKPDQPLRPMDTSKAWLGDPQTLSIAPESKFTGDKERASWLLDEAAARRWQEFGKTGDVKDRTPPPAPTNLKAVQVDGKVQLSWSAEADLETGIKRFHIFRDGKRIGFLGGAVTEVNKLGYYQTWNYGDEPEPRPAPMVFLDKAGTAASRYQVTTENHARMESAKSAEVAVTRE